MRGLARKVGISSPFVSDIELGGRFPSEEILAKLAKALNVSPEDLKHYDNREPIADLIDSDPKLMRDFYSLQGQPRFALFDFWVLPKAFNARAALSASAFSSKPR